VLTVTIPMSEKAKPRKIDIAHGGGRKSIDTHTTVESE
jgi:HSP20 family protein